MKLLLPVTACLIYLLCGCSAPANISASSLVHSANDYIVDCQDSFITKLNAKNDVMIVAAYFAQPRAKNTFYIAARKMGIWKGYFYVQPSLYNPISVIDSFAITDNKICDSILAFVLKKRIFQLPDQDGLQPCTKAPAIIGGTSSLYLGIPGKIIGRAFTAPDYYDTYCPAPNRTAFIEAYNEIEGLFPKTSH